MTNFKFTEKRVKISVKCKMNPHKHWSQGLPMVKRGIHKENLRESLDKSHRVLKTAISYTEQELKFLAIYNHMRS